MNCVSFLKTLQNGTLAKEMVQVNIYKSVGCIKKGPLGDQEGPEQILWRKALFRHHLLLALWFFLQQRGHALIVHQKWWTIIYFLAPLIKEQFWPPFFSLLYLRFLSLKKLSCTGTKSYKSLFQDGWAFLHQVSPLYFSVPPEFSGAATAVMRRPFGWNLPISR